MVVRTTARVSFPEATSLRKAALAIAAIHLASLLHDDVVDCSELRRGVETLNVRHSDKISILFGDHVFISSLMIAKEVEHPEAFSIIHNAVRRMVKGEILDSLDGEFFDEDTYIQVISDKTASLFAASGELGVILSGSDGRERIWARELGESLGIAYQIIDDTLDYNGNRDIMGKPTFMDAMSGNMTLPLIYSLTGMASEERKEFFSGIESNVKELSEFVKKRGGIDYALQKARCYAEKARETLDRFDNKKVRYVFELFFDQLMNRHF